MSMNTNFVNMIYFSGSLWKGYVEWSLLSMTLSNVYIPKIYPSELYFIPFQSDLLAGPFILVPHWLKVLIECEITTGDGDDYQFCDCICMFPVPGFVFLLVSSFSIVELNTFLISTLVHMLLIFFSNHFV